MIPLTDLRRAYTRSRDDMRSIGEPACWWEPFVFGAAMLVVMGVFTTLLFAWFGG